MSVEENIIQRLIEGVSKEQVNQFFLKVCDDFRPDERDESHCLKEDYKKDFGSIKSLGLIDFSMTERLIVCVTKLDIPLTENTSKKKQYEVSRQVLRAKGADGGLFIFYDQKGKFRFSFVRRYATGLKREFTTFKRYSFYVDPALPNKTFKQQMKRGSFTGLDKIQEIFSLESVTKKFYDEFSPQFDDLAKSVQGVTQEGVKKDFALLFVIRIIFIGFVQKKGWLKHQDFIQRYWAEYNAGKNEVDSFYSKWLEPLFFESLNSPPGRKVKYGNNSFSTETEELLQMAPFLNGELFKPHTGIDNRGIAFIPDEHISKFIDFLFQYNFTIEENTNIDEELELSPEFLGIIFERLVNKADGAVYTPRTEVDLMCRLSLVKWLEKNTKCPMDELLHLFFREGGHGQEYDDDQKYGSFSTNQVRELHDKLSVITVCDPAAGSGAFPVGMMQVLVDIFTVLQEKQPTWPSDLPKPTVFERKKAIIANSLYGAEVKHWAVWINQLRLWLSLFIDMPDDYKNSFEPLLPSLNFKIRCGDSLVQRIGGKIFPVRGHAELPSSLKGEVTKLKGMKIAFFDNDRTVTAHDIKNKEYTVFRKILETQLDDTKLKLTHASGAKPKQTDMFGNNAPEQQSLPLNAQKISELKATIQELEEELRALKQDHPFIWGIEFAEIFYERNGFDIVIGNPPYIRQEEIGDPCGFVLDNKDYKEILKKTLQTDYPEWFKNIKRIDGKSDLYTYFYLHTLNLLNSSGFHCFICSNSWLDVGFGVWMQEFLLNHCRIHYIIDNHAKRSFATADVNTIISLIEAPQKKMTWGDKQAKFVAIKCPFEEAIITENLKELERVQDTTINSVFRAYVLNHDKLKEEGLDTDDETDLINVPYIGEKWGGKYLRAPDIFAIILAKGKDKFVKLKNVADIRFGIKTGCNEFFYLTEEEAKYWAIEKEFLKPVVKSSREVKSQYIKSGDLSLFLFVCNYELEEIKATNAYKYIMSGLNLEIVVKQGKDKGKKIIGVPNVSSVQGRKRWFSIDPQEVPNGILPCSFDSSFKFYYNSAKALADKRLYQFYGDKNILAYMNSTPYILSLELGSGGMFGEGLLELTVEQFKETNILNIEIPDSVLITRDILNVFKESGIDPESETPIEEQEPNPLPDRKALDDVVFDALGLTAEERKDVYRAVCRLVWNRISKAKNV